MNDPAKWVVDLLSGQLGLVDIACATCGMVAKGTPRKEAWYCSKDCDASSLRVERDRLRAAVEAIAKIDPIAQGNCPFCCNTTEHAEWCDWAKLRALVTP